MAMHTTARIRNVALVGHHGSGKTTLAEAMLHAGGALKRPGTVAAGTTASDYHPSEQERQMSVFTSLLHAGWEDCKINILDTPGYPDFAGEVIAAMKVADAALYVMDAVEGVQVGTELAWTYGEMTATPAMFVINHLDRAGSSFRALAEQIERRFGRGATVVQIAGGEGTRSIIDVLLMKQLYFPEGQTEPEVRAIDEAFREEAEALHLALVEDIAENDESLMELYFEKGTLTEDEMRAGLREAMIRRQLFPIFITSATEGIGVARLMRFICNVCPSPADMPPAATTNGQALAPDAEGEPVAFVYRTMAEPHVGEYSFVRVYGGTLRPGLDLENASSGAAERLGPLYLISGAERTGADGLAAGDLGALVKLKSTHTNDTLRAGGRHVALQPIEFPEPRYRAAIRTAREGEEDKLAQGLHQLTEEDPSLVVTHDALLRQILLAGQGEMHLQIAQYRLQHRFGVEVVFERPRVSYRETVRRRARAAYRHKKQSGGAGQFADLSLLVEPLTQTFDPPSDVSVRGEETVETGWGAHVHFVNAIVGGVIDMRRFFGAIQKGVLQAMAEGPVAGYPVGAVRVAVCDGGMHAVDSNEAAFRSAAFNAFRDAFRQARPVVMEPVHVLEVTVPADHTGDVISDLNTRRARIQGIEAEGFFQKVAAHVPEAELYRYSTALRSMTHGRGLHRARFSHYDAMPRHVQDELTASAEA